ncbi:MAG: hypothetical protein IPO19_12185 [Rhodoferax sp.]|nr:hypothetical protein [Rhodoferax sp.]
MSLRGNKRRVALLFDGRFHGSFVWRSGEDQAWLDIAPVGREFGSPDYERLSILDTYSWGNITEQEAMRQLDVDRHGLVAMLEADGLELTDEVRASHRKAIEGLSTPHKIGDITALKGMFGKTARTVTIEDMNPVRRKP